MRVAYRLAEHCFAFELGETDSERVVIDPHDGSKSLKNLALFNDSERFRHKRHHHRFIEVNGRLPASHPSADPQHAACKGLDEDLGRFALGFGTGFLQLIHLVVLNNLRQAIHCELSSDANACGCIPDRCDTGDMLVTQRALKDRLGLVLKNGSIGVGVGVFH